jgi:hypothetical protein
MIKQIEIPHSLIPLLSNNNQMITTFCFYHHLRQHFQFPLKKFNSVHVKSLSFSTGWSIKTIYSRFNHLKSIKVITVKSIEVNLLHPDIFYEKLVSGYKKTPFQIIGYTPKLFELKIKALPLYLNYLNQVYRIDNKIKKYLGEKFSPKLLTQIKKDQLYLLLNKPYCYSEVKNVPILTLKRSAELLNRRSSNSSYKFLKKLQTCGLITIHKMPKAQIKNKSGNLRVALEEPPMIIFFSPM